MIKKNRSLFRNVFNLVLAMMLIGTCIFFNSVAADQSTTLNNSDLDIGKSVEVNDEGENLYNIVFSLPTAIKEEPTEVDIVFVMDQTSIANYSQVRNQINEFLDGIANNDKIKLNIGVIKFALDIDKSVSSLMTVTTSNLATVKNLFRASISSGSNMYGGILAGKELLETGNALDENKYLILASDFGGYKSDAGNGKGLSFFYHHVGANQGVTAVTDNSEFHSKYFAYNTIDLTNAFFTVDKVDNLIRNKTFFNGISVSDETEKYLTQFGPSIGEYPDSWRNPYANYGIINHTWTAQEKETLIENLAFINRPDFPSSFEKNIYTSGNLLLEMKDTMNVIAVTSPYHDISDGQTYKYKFRSASDAFKLWFEQNIGSRYEVTENETFVDMLDDLESELNYLVGKGEIVDVVTPEFEMVSGYEKVTLNGIELPKTILDSGDLAFGDEENGVYPYVYTYEKNNDVETIKWIINKEASVGDQLKFKFGIKLIDRPTTPGSHTLNTNLSADIHYMSSKEVGEGVTSYTKTQSMPSPTVNINIGEVISKYVDEDGVEIAEEEVVTGIVGTTYTTIQKVIAGYEFVSAIGNTNDAFTEDPITVTYVYRENTTPPLQPKTTYTVEKEWINGPDNHPDIQVQLYQNGSAHGDPVILKNGTTTYTWTDLDEKDPNGAPYVYTVDELHVPEGYTKTVKDNVIINTYTLTKDEDDKEKDPLPQTGVSAYPIVLATTMIINGLIFVRLSKIKKKENM